MTAKTKTKAATKGRGKKPATETTKPAAKAKEAKKTPSAGKSLRTWWAWDSAGLIPRPIRIGRSTLWRTAELKAWVKAGCPRRAEWESRA